MSKSVRDTLDDQGRQIDVVDYTCDGCGKTQIGDDNGKGAWDKPRKWFERTIAIGTPRERKVHACTQACIAAAEKTLGVDRGWVIPDSILGIS